MIIAITNRKGGVGKSTIASHLAAGLAIKGYNVGLVDTDSQGNASDMLGLAPSDGLYRLLVDKAPLHEVAVLVPKENYGDHTVTGNLALIPGHRNTYKIPHLLQSDETFLFLERLEEFQQRAQLHYTIVDTSPSLSMFDGSIYLAADAFLYVTETELLSMRGIQEAMKQLENFSAQRQRFMNKTSRVLGIIPNKFRSKTIIHQENLKLLQEAFGQVVWNPVALRTIWTECSNYHRPVFIEAPESPAARQAWEIVNRVEAEVLAWQRTDENA